MLEHVPGWLGHALRGVRAGSEKLAIVDLARGVEASLDLSSPAFANGGRLPERFTGDGTGVSPPLLWGRVPTGTERMALIVEDPDAPTPSPLVHAIVWNLDPDAGGLAEGAIVADGHRADGQGDADGDVGRNSFREGWLPPDPPTGHGVHNYAFQLFALRGSAILGATPGRSALVDAMRGHVLAVGLLTGTYSRGEDVPVRLSGRTATV